MSLATLFPHFFMPVEPTTRADPPDDQMIVKSAEKEAKPFW